ncbi:MAG: cytochrome c biogenesis protein CcdA [Proteobacteria bacterium]|nr:cytochrome c biogenesis protein CcdA [Pseudomonadota bacterium]
MFLQDVTYPAAFLAGLLSFFSPCILPLLPGYFTFLAGTSLDHLVKGDLPGVRRRLLFSTLAFVSGFSLVFILLGASASFLGSMADEYKVVLRVGGGLLVMVFGLHVSGILRLPFLDVEKKIHVAHRPVHVMGMVLIGMAFGAGWTPCIGPLLGSILAVAASRDTVGQGVALLTIYSAGLAIPFLVMSLFTGSLLTFLKRAVRFMRWINYVAGGLLIVMGALLIWGRMPLQ